MTHNKKSWFGHCDHYLGTEERIIMKVEGHGLVKDYNITQNDMKYECCKCHRINYIHSGPF